MFQSEEPVYAVVVNEDEDFLVWPEGRKTPDGWLKTGFTGSKSECLQHINQHLVPAREREGSSPSSP